MDVDGQPDATASEPEDDEERNNANFRFGRHVAELRTSAGLTQQQVADRSGLNRVTISLVENGWREVGITRAKALADALGVSIERLFEYQDPR